MAVLLVVAFAAWRTMAHRVQRAEARISELELAVASFRGAGIAPEAPPAASDDAVAGLPAPPTADSGAASEPVPVDVPAAPEPPAPPVVEPPPAPPSRAVAPRPARRPAVDIDWERWIGVRGAAVAGGAVLALAALLFFKYSIEHGLIPPVVRVILGLIVGLAAVVASEVLRKRGYEPAANALAGAGAVVLYAALWAANRLYDLLPTLPAYGAMILVTVACGVLAWRHASIVIAVLGLVGGFATPLLLSTGSDHPIGLFGYILLLDLGLLTLARRRGWPVLGLLGLGATVFFQAGWIFTRMDQERAVLGLLILAVFAALFAVAAARGRDGVPANQELAWRASGVVGVLLPFALTLYIAGRANLGEHLWATAALLLFLSLAAAWTGRELGQPQLAVAAAVADIAVVLVWCGRTSFDLAISWEAVIISIGLAGAFHLVLEWRSRRAAEGPRNEASDWSPVVASIGFFCLLVGVSLGPVASLWPWLTGWAAFASMLLRQSRLSSRPWLASAAGGLAGLGLALFFAVHGRTPIFPDPAMFFAIVSAAAVAFQLLAVAQRDRDERRWMEVAAVALPAAVLLVLVGAGTEPHLAPGVYYAASILLALLVVLAGTRLGEGRVLLGAMVVLALQHLQWVGASRALGQAPAAIVMALTAQLVAVALFVAWPFLAVRRLGADRWAWYAAALAPVAWFPSLKRLYEMRFGDAFIGLLPVALGGLALAAAFRARAVWAPGDPGRRRALAWFAAVALAFASVAVPLQLDRQWITIGWALEGLAVIVLWKHLDHPGLKYLGMGLLAAVTVRLVANPAVLGYQPSGGWPVVNWLAYTYLVPAACLVGAAAILRPLEVARAMDWERPLYASGHAVGAMGAAVATIAVVFSWINLTVVDAFSGGGALTLTLERMPARDLTLSLAWAVYALLLLAIGMARRSQGLRWVSLAFLVLTIGKVFLYDLGELKDLYRVASLLGLAVSLILVSLAYQRFVFRPTREERT